MWLLRLALRNLLRNRSRTALTGSAIAISFMLVATLNHFEYGVWMQRIEGSVQAVSGSVVVQHPATVADPKPEHAVSNSGAIADALRAELPQARVLRRVFVGGLLTSPRNTAPLMLAGVEPSAEAQVTKIDDLFAQADRAREALPNATVETRPALERDAARGIGAWLADDAPSGVVIGLPVARSLQVEVGDRLVFMTQVGDELQSVPLWVQGIYSTGIDRADAQIAYAPIGATQALLIAPGTTEPIPDPAHQIAVHLDTDRQLDALTARLIPVVDRADVAVLTWRQALPSLQRQMELDRNFSKVLHGFILAIVAVVILTTLLMSALERTREIGVLMALGMRPIQVQIMFWTEAALLGAAGVGAGLLLHLAPTAYLAWVGVDYGELMAGSADIAGVVLDPVLRASFDVDSLIFFVPTTFLLTLSASLWPAWRASRLAPVDAMRHT